MQEKFNSYRVQEGMIEACTCYDELSLVFGKLQFEAVARFPSAMDFIHALLKHFIDPS
jgi:hypothetical protein